MGASAGKIQVDLEAQAARFSQPMKQAGKDIAALREQMDHLKRAAGGSDLFDKLREGLGKRSALGETAELLRGRGPVAGLTHAAEAIKNVAEEAGKLKQEFDQGKISAGEMAEKIVSQVPIVGQFWQAGRAIREAFTGEQAALEQANAEAKLLDRVLEANRKTTELMKEEARGFAEYIEQAAHDIRAANLSGDKSVSGKFAANQENYEAADAADAARLRKERDEQIKKVQEANAAAKEEARKATADAVAANAGDDADAKEAANRHLLVVTAAAKMAAQQEANAIAQINANYADKERAARARNAAKKLAEDSRISEEQAEHNKQEAAAVAKALADTQAETEAQRLKNAGTLDAQLEAEKVILRRQLDDKINVIRQNAEKEKEQYSPNNGPADPTNINRIQAEADRQIAAERALEAEKEKAAEQENQKRKVEDITAAVKERQEAEQHLFEQGRAAAEAAKSPLEKYRDTLYDIKRYLDANAITQAEAAALKANAVKDLFAAGDPVDRRKVGAQVRRFDFTLANQEKNDPIEDVKRAERKIQENTARGNFYLQQIWQQGLVPAQVADF